MKTSKQLYEEIFALYRTDFDTVAEGNDMGYEDFIDKVRALLARHDGAPVPGADIPNRIVQIIRHDGGPNSSNLFALSSDGLVYESRWDGERHRFTWNNRFDPLPLPEGLW
jgi:hypothetical protein